MRQRMQTSILNVLVAAAPARQDNIIVLTDITVARSLLSAELTQRTPVSNVTMMTLRAMTPVTVITIAVIL